MNVLPHSSREVVIAPDGTGARDQDTVVGQDPWRRIVAVVRNVGGIVRSCGLRKQESEGYQSADDLWGDVLFANEDHLPRPASLNPERLRVLWRPSGAA